MNEKGLDEIEAKAYLSRKSNMVVEKNKADEFLTRLKITAELDILDKTTINVEKIPNMSKEEARKILKLKYKMKI